jgi:hypothetical protein
MMTVVGLPEMALAPRHPRPTFSRPLGSQFRAYAINVERQWYVRPREPY